jgi:hypothetical protein
MPFVWKHEASDVIELGDFVTNTYCAKQVLYSSEWRNSQKLNSSVQAYNSCGCCEKVKKSDCTNVRLCAYEEYFLISLQKQYKQVNINALKHTKKVTAKSKPQQLIWQHTFSLMLMLPTWRRLISDIVERICDINYVCGR